LLPGLNGVPEQLTGWIGAPGDTSPAGLVADAAAAGAGGGWAIGADAGTERLHQLAGDGIWLTCVGRPGGVPDTGRVLSGLRPGQVAGLADCGGSFVVARWDEHRRELLLATDRFGALPLYYTLGPRGLCFGTDLEWVSHQAPGGPRLDQQALYDYLFYSVVPSQRSIYAGVHKLAAASALHYRAGRLEIARYWSPDFTRSAVTPADLADRTVESVRSAVARVAELPGLGCFLSGGLDSSTVCGMAARARPAATRAFNIGFDVPEFDESAYARITARHFGLELHEHSIRSTDIGGCIERVLGGFAEPFGNPSAVSAYLCADFARAAGVQHLLAGDGGDELFGGNERYQKQSLFNLYGDLPAWLRRGAVDRLAALRAAAPVPLAKLASYVRQARVPLPDRLFSYNLLVRNDPATVLTPEFLATVDTDSPYRYARGLFGAPAHGDALDRLLYLDWTTTLTDNDLPKVNVACQLAGVEVHFPLLDPAVVAVSTEIPSAAKLTLRDLRHFYKQAFAGFLPPAILTKAKHGFGVPVGIWINRDPVLRERVCSRLDALAGRGIVRREIIAEVLARQASDHASYYGALLWPLFALEEWLQSRRL
jgi:asparagine synthase (glutamine-hydrolysing)